MHKEIYIKKVKGHAVVFGGSGGIGYHVVLALVENGAKAVSFTYGKNRKEAEELSEELKEAGVRHHFESVDIRDEGSIRKFLEKSVDVVGEEIRYAINTVAYSPNTLFQDQNDEEWRKVFDVNVLGNMHVTRAVAERMQLRLVLGSIVLFSSDNAELSRDPKSAHYDGSKAWVSSNVRNFAKEYAPKIRINVLEPGWVETKMNDTVSKEDMGEAINRTLLKRLARPEEIAQAAIFTLTNTFLTGGVVRVNGGFQ